MAFRGGRQDADPRVESASFPPPAPVPGAYPRRGVCVVAAGIHARPVGERAGRRAVARALARVLFMVLY